MRNVIIFLSILALSSGGCSIKEPYFKKIDNLVVISASPSLINISADLTLHNPNKISCTLKEVDIEIFSKKMAKLSRFSQVLDVKMPVKSDFVVPIQISVDPKDLLSEPGDILGSVLSALGNREVELFYKGTSKVEKLGITISVPVESKVSFNLGGYL